MELKDIDESNLRKTLHKDGNYRTYDDVVLLRSRIVQSSFLNTCQLGRLQFWELDALCQHFQLVTKEAGEIIFQTGDAADGFFIVFTGEVLENSESGQEEHGIGDVFGFDDGLYDLDHNLPQNTGGIENLLDERLISCRHDEDDQDTVGSGQRNSIYVNKVPALLQPVNGQQSKFDTGLAIPPLRKLQTEGWNQISQRSSVSDGDTSMGTISVMDPSGPAWRMKASMMDDFLLEDINASKSGTDFTAAQSSIASKIMKSNPCRSSTARAKIQCELIFASYKSYVLAMDPEKDDFINKVFSSTANIKRPATWNKLQTSADEPSQNYNMTLHLCRKLLVLPAQERPMEDLEELAYLLSLRAGFFMRYNRNQQTRLLQHMWIAAILDERCIYHYNAPAKAFYMVLTGKIQMRSRNIFAYEVDNKVTEVPEKDIMPFEVFGDAELSSGHANGRREMSAFNADLFTELLFIKESKYREIMGQLEAEEREEMCRVLLGTEGFNYTTREICADIAKHIELRSFALNQTVCTQNKKATEMLIITRGECDVARMVELQATKPLTAPGSKDEEGRQSYRTIGRIGPRTVIGLYVIVPEKILEEVHWQETITTTSSLLVYVIPRILFYTIFPPEYRQLLHRGLKKVKTNMTMLSSHIPVNIPGELVKASDAWGGYRQKLVDNQMSTRWQNLHHSSTAPSLLNRANAPASFGYTLPRNQLLNKIPANRASHPQMHLPATLHPGLATRPDTSQGFITKKDPEPKNADQNHNNQLPQAQLPRPATTDPRVEQIATKRKNSANQLMQMMQQHDLYKHPAERYQKGENINDRWCPFQVLELKANKQNLRCLFRVLGGYKSVEDAQCAVADLYGEMFKPQLEMNSKSWSSSEKSVMGDNWQHFQSYELLNLSKPHHIIIFCLDAPIEFVSFEPGNHAHAHIKEDNAKGGQWKSAPIKTSFLPGVSFPPFSKVLAQEFAVLTLQETLLDKKSRQAFVLDSLLHPPFYRQITMIRQIHGCYPTKHLAAKAAFQIKETSETTSAPVKFVIVPMYQWLPCSIEELATMDVEHKDIQTAMQEEVVQLGVEIRGHNLNGIAATGLHSRQRTKHRHKKIQAEVLNKKNKEDDLHFDYYMVKKLQVRAELVENVEARSIMRRRGREVILKASNDANEIEKELNKKIFEMNMPMTKNDRAAVRLRQQKDRAQMNVFNALHELDYKKMLEQAEEEALEQARCGQENKSANMSGQAVILNEKLEVLENIFKTKHKWERKIRRGGLAALKLKKTLKGLP